MASTSANSQMLVRLEAQLPTRVAQAVGDGGCGILGNIGSVHRLQRESLEVEIDECFGRGSGLRIDKLQLVAMMNHEFASRLGADANPIESLRGRDRAVGLDRDLE